MFSKRIDIGLIINVINVIMYILYAYITFFVIRIYFPLLCGLSNFVKHGGQLIFLYILKGTCITYINDLEFIYLRIIWIRCSGTYDG